MPDNDPRRAGVLTDWNDERGFGFIEPIGSGPRAFAHISEFPRGNRPTTGTPVTYLATSDESGRARAASIRYAGRPPGPPGRTRKATAAVVASLAALGVLAVAVLVLDRSSLLIIAYAVMSLVSLAAYGLDKAAAQKGELRTSESTLHTLDLLGGWPGGLAARHLFRHKTVKQPFRTVFWMTVVVNCAAVGWFLVANPTLGG